MQKYFMKGYKETFRKISCIIAWNITKRFQEDFLERCFYETENAKNISETLPKYFTKGYKETFQKDFLYHCLKYYEKISKRFLGKMFLWNWKCKQIFPKPCKNISRKVIRKPFKNISCIIAWKVLAKFSQHFWYGMDIVKKHFKKCYCKVFQSFSEIFLANFL